MFCKKTEWNAKTTHYTDSQRCTLVITIKVSHLNFMLAAPFSRVRGERLQKTYVSGYIKMSSTIELADMPVGPRLLNLLLIF